METIKKKSVWPQIILATFVIGGVEILWTLYNTYVPLWLQAGGAGFNTGSSAIAGFGLSASVTGIIMTFDNIGGLFISPVIGVLSDTTRTRWGRRIPWIVFTTPVAVLAFVLIPFVVMMIPPELSGQTAELTKYLIPFMVILFAMIIPIQMMRNPAASLVYDIAPTENRTMASAWSSLIGGSTGIIAAIVAAGLFQIYAGLPFWIFGAIVIVIVAFVAVFIKEPEQFRSGNEDNAIKLKFKDIIDTVKELPKESKNTLLLVYLATFFFYLAFSQLGSFLSSYAVAVLGLEVGSAGLLYAAGGSAFIISAIPAGLLAKKISRKSTAIIGMFIYAVGSAVTYFTTLPLVVWIAMPISGIGMAFTMVSLDPMVVDSAPNDKVLGTLVSMQQTLKTLSYIAGPIAGGFLIEKLGNNYSNTWIVSFVGCVLGIVVLLKVKTGEVRINSEVK